MRGKYEPSQRERPHDLYPSVYPTTFLAAPFQTGCPSPQDRSIHLLVRRFLSRISEYCRLCTSLQSAPKSTPLNSAYRFLPLSVTSYDL